MKFKKFNYKKVISTNNTAINIIKKNDLDFGLITSEIQIKGKGQYGRKWISLKGNLFVSFFYNLDNHKTSLKNLTKINCNLVKKTISYFYKNRISYKPPNDLLIKGKKICGILQEKIVKGNKKFLIVGVGLNVIQSPDILNYPTTNLYAITGKKYNYKFILKLLESNFKKNFLGKDKL